MSKSIKYYYGVQFSLNSLYASYPDFCIHTLKFPPKNHASHCSYLFTDMQGTGNWPGGKYFLYTHSNNYCIIFNIHFNSGHCMVDIILHVSLKTDANTKICPNISIHSIANSICPYPAMLLCVIFPHI